MVLSGGNADAVPQPPYRHLELFGIALTKTSCELDVSVRLAACLFCGRDILKNSTNPKKRTWWLTEIEDILERRKKSYDETHFAFLQKTG